MNSSTQLQRLQSYSSTDFLMMHYDPEATQAKANDLSSRMMQVRHEFMRRIDEVTVFLHANGLPYIWTMYPPPAIGGIVRSANVLEAFIDLNIDADERPKLLQILDLLNKALLIGERQIKEHIENPPSRFAGGFKSGTRGLGAAMSWLFPVRFNERYWAG